MLGGPVLGLFLLGVFVPFANSKGAFAGTISGLTLTIWLFLGHVAYGIKYPKKLMYTFGCNATNIPLAQDCSVTYMPVPTAPIPVKSTMETFHSLSYTWYGTCAVIVTLTVGIIVSLLTSNNLKLKNNKIKKMFLTKFKGNHDDKKIDPCLMIPIFDKVLPWLPEKMRNALKCGYNFEVRFIWYETSFINLKYFQKSENIEKIELKIKTEVEYQEEKITQEMDDFGNVNFSFDGIDENENIYIVEFHKNIIIRLFRITNLNQKS